jgi:hypothetical protein
LELVRLGDVVVVDGGGDVPRALVSEIMKAIAQSRGATGFMIDGAIRDSDAFAKDDFPCYARAAIHTGPYKNGPGEIDVPVCIGGMVVQPDDIIVGDGDGVVHSRRISAPACWPPCRHKKQRRRRSWAASPPEITRVPMRRPPAETIGKRDGAVKARRRISRGRDYFLGNGVCARRIKSQILARLGSYPLRADAADMGTWFIFQAILAREDLALTGRDLKSGNLRRPHPTVSQKEDRVRRFLSPAFPYLRRHIDRPWNVIIEGL